MNDKILMLLTESRKLNGDVITLTRILIIALLAYFIDGLQYRELKSALNISDGKLISNLRKLEKFEYIRREEVTIDSKKLDVYYITENGLKEFKKIIRWMNLITNLVKIDEERFR